MMKFNASFGHVAAGILAVACSFALTACGGGGGGSNGFGPTTGTGGGNTGGGTTGGGDTGGGGGTTQSAEGLASYQSLSVSMQQITSYWIDISLDAFDTDNREPAQIVDLVTGSHTLSLLDRAASRHGANSST